MRGNQSAKVTDIIHRCSRFNLEAGIARYAEALAGFVGFPVSLALDACTAGAGGDFHDLRYARVEYQR